MDARANAKTRPMATPRGPKAQLLLKASHHRGVDGDHDVHDVEDDLMDDDDDDDDDEDLIKMRASKQRRPNKRLRQVTFFSLSTLCIECCQKRETLGIFTKHGSVDDNISRIVKNK